MKYPALVEETTDTTGTIGLILNGQIAGRRAFSVAGDNAWLPYLIEGSDGSWEKGIGQIIVGTSSNELTRNIVLESSNADALINLPTGTHKVRCADLGGPIVALGRGAQAIRSTSQVVGAGVYANVTYDGENKDTDALWSLTPNPDRLYAPAWAEVCQVSLRFHITAASIPDAAVIISIEGFYVSTMPILVDQAAFVDDGFGTKVAEIIMTSPPLVLAGGNQAYFWATVDNRSSVAVTLSGDDVHMRLDVLA